MEADDRRAQRLAVTLGWVAGLLLGLLVDYGGYVALGDDYPKGYTTFALLAAGGLGGMTLADRLGARALKVMSLAVGVLVAVGLFVFLLPLGG
ncbi:MAG: hypothetical protein H5U40_00850 [Polyangiaceae bacterium]|nr:hypothetical protein [Polyangiaceae bacterium]